MKPEEIVEIKQRFSKDLSLFYTVDEVRELFNYKRPEYQNICKLVSQQYLGYSSIAIPNQLDLLMSMQSVLTQLKVFNFLTEVKGARELLFKVCQEMELPNAPPRKDLLQKKS